MKTILFSFLFVPIIVFGQLKEKDSLKINADLSLTGFLQAGNVETVIFRATSNFSFKPWKKALFETNNSYVYQEFGKQKADEDILSLNFLRFTPERTISPLVLGFVSTNFRREIDIRYIFGAGATFNIFKEKKNFLKFALTFEYENTDFKKTVFNQSQYNGNASINTWRGTLWVKGEYHMFKNKMIFSHESYFQPSLEESDNYRWRADFSLEFPIWKFLSFKINYLDTFESVVIQDQKQDDSVISFGFKIKNYL
ncbi:DUF481 domain-containing protein [Winogradskyella alexanderae]|uniref:DUF481 domain-containing protein n=1 Tax=Winogradskyella alexanderae TaxID=2877123 RepID=A0ABS7XRE7_9FLAO|nr:DUF481 domain-containing protein [Winogradskyella alexanderae]MCA0132315.1 DUF481 domain-containing protein [Winogradskyella alexanderae]